MYAPFEGSWPGLFQPRPTWPRAPGKDFFISLPPPSSSFVASSSGQRADGAPFLVLPGAGPCLGALGQTRLCPTPCQRGTGRVSHGPEHWACVMYPGSVLGAHDLDPFTVQKGQGCGHRLTPIKYSCNTQGHCVGV